jgi:Large polyvalent protein-associated domain 7
VQRGAHYHFRLNDEVRAFSEEGRALSTKHDSEVVVRGMVDAAQARGWNSINVEGSEEFRRRVWMEASLRQMEVRGYKASEQEHKDLDALLRRRQQENPDVGGRINPNAEERSGGAARTREQENERVVDFGRAPYKFDRTETQSFFVTLQNADRQERTVWGKDLERALAENQVAKGDVIKLSLEKKTEIEVNANVKDSENHVVGTQRIDAHRNTWRVEKIESQERQTSTSTQSERAAVRSIEERASELAARTVDGVTSTQAREVVRADRADFERLSTPESKDRAALAIGRNSDEQRGYRAELGATDPSLLARAERQTNQLPDNDKKDPNKAVVMATVARVAEAREMSPELTNKVVEEASRAYDRRSAEGQVPTVQVYDASAPRRLDRERAPEQELATPSPERIRERSIGR